MNFLQFDYTMLIQKEYVSYKKKKIRPIFSIFLINIFRVYYIIARDINLSNCRNTIAIIID